MTKNETALLITPSLLNSWLYIYQAPLYVREAEGDEMCLEDKQLSASRWARSAFLSTLRRAKSETTPAQQRGIDYEDATYQGKTSASPYVEGGQFQIVGKKYETIGGVDFLLYGRLDCLKGGTIYDIKRVSQYSVQKYLHSAQHPFYLHLFPRATKFTYLVDDGYALHTETYFRDEVKPIRSTIEEFIGWLKEEELWDDYELYWKARRD